MTRQIPLALIACIALLLSVGIAATQPKQPCSAAMPSNPRAYWSWRLIDGRKCWYEGKPMLSKSLLEWPAQSSSGRPNSEEKVTGGFPETKSNPLDAQARVLNVPESFEALWRARVERR